MIQKLPYDILTIISYYFHSVYDVNKLILLNKDFSIINTNSFYFNWGRSIYANNISCNQLIIPELISYYPYPNIKLELQRIEDYQLKLILSKKEKWDKNDYYKYWNSLENNLLSKQFSNCAL